jgi:hypothetical protein
MNSFPDELIYVLIFAALLLFQYVVQRIRRRRQQSEAPQEEPLPQDESLPEIWGRAPAIPAVSPVPVERVGRSEALAASAAIPRRRSAVRSLLRTKRDLRRAIIIMTILGPCRAFEPFDIRQLPTAGDAPSSHGGDENERHCNEWRQ